jgi:hypothetical protein
MNIQWLPAWPTSKERRRNPPRGSRVRLRAGVSGRAAVNGLTRDLDFLRLAAEPFARAPKKSIDCGHGAHAAVVPADLGWSDVGSWSTVWEVLDHDQAGNAICWTAATALGWSDSIGYPLDLPIA